MSTCHSPPIILPLVVPRSESLSPSLITDSVKLLCFVSGTFETELAVATSPAGIRGQKQATGAEQGNEGRINNAILSLLKNGQNPGDGILVSSLGMSDEKSHDVHE